MYAIRISYEDTTTQDIILGDASSMDDAIDQGIAALEAMYPDQDFMVEKNRMWLDGEWDATVYEDND